MHVDATTLPVKPDYPTRPVRLIEPFGAGGGVEVLARVVAEQLSELWGQPVTVENHRGNGSTAAPALVAQSPADGYTLLVHTALTPTARLWCPTCRMTRSMTSSRSLR